MNQPIDPAFNTVKNSEDLKSWLMRAYFNPSKHLKEKYYSPEVSKDNIFEFISNRDNKFPQTPESIISLWSILPGLRKGLNSIANEEVTESLYTKGNETLANIGKTIGGLSPTMVQKISDQATLKLGTLLRAINADNRHLANEAFDKIDDAFLTVSESYADAVKEANSADEVLGVLLKNKLLTSEEVQVVDEIEKQALEDVIAFANLEETTQAEIEEVFLQDLNRPVSVFLSMQYPISKIVFPPPKSGRPKKVK